jgi:hypothetical protein
MDFPMMKKRGFPVSIFSLIQSIDKNYLLTMAHMDGPNTSKVRESLTNRPIGDLN